MPSINKLTGNNVDKEVSSVSRDDPGAQAARGTGSQTSQFGRSLAQARRVSASRPSSPRAR